jgi:vacuolar-type H+-ATPase subunit D/Vma8
MNQLNNTLELQKSKQERLQSHIQSLEKQISDMVNDYESKLMSAYYGNVDELR